MAIHKQTVQSYDFAVDGAATNVIFTLPANHTFARVTSSTGIVFPNGPLLGRVGTGGSIDSGATDYIRGCGRDTTWQASAEVDWLLQINDGHTDNKEMRFNFYNMNMAAPVFAMGMGYDKWISRPWYPQGIRQAITPLDQIQIINAGGTNITAGKIWCVSYERVATVTPLPTPSGTVHTLSGLTKAKGMITCCSYDSTVTPAAQHSQMRVSTGGVIQDQAGDYLEGKVGSNFQDQVTSETELCNSGAALRSAFALVGYGFMETAFRSVVINHADLALDGSGTGKTKDVGWTTAVEANNEWSARTGNVADGGTVYWVEYEV